MADEYIKKQPLLDKAKEMSGDVFATPKIISEIENAPVCSLDLHKEEVENLIKYHPLTKYPVCVICGVVDALIYTKSPEDYYEFLRSIKTEAYKEFAARLKENAVVGAGTRYASYRKVNVWEINNLLTELTERREDDRNG